MENRSGDWSADLDLYCFQNKIFCSFKLMLYVPVINLSFMSVCVPSFLDRTSTKQRIKCLATCLSIAALWSPARKGLASWLFYCVFVIFPCGVLGQVWYLIVLIPDLCLLPCFIQGLKAVPLGSLKPVTFSILSLTLYHWATMLHSKQDICGLNQHYNLVCFYSKRKHSS